MTWPKILMCGDSLTQLSFDGWGARLANVYQRRCDLLNRGYAGYNTRFYLPLLPEILQEAPIALALLFFGANDAAIQEVDPHHHVPLEEYAENLRTMVNQVRTHHANASILLLSPPPVHHEQRLGYQRQRYGDRATGVLERKCEVTAQYAAQCQKVASELHVPFLDIFHLMLEQDNWESFLCDGLHFSPPGHDFVANMVLEGIALHFPSLVVTPDPVTGQYCNSASTCPSLSQNGPYHDEIDAQCLAKSFPK